MPHFARVAAVLALLTAAPTAAASQGPLAVGDAIAPFELMDQHEKSHTVDAGVRVLLLSRDMDGGGVVREALERQGDAAGAFLAERSAVYVADVSRMPGLVRRMIAIPRMRGRPYPVLLDQEGTTTAALPSQAGKASVLWLDGLRLVRVEQVDTPDALLELLGAGN
jgi:hypothetical protein